MVDSRISITAKLFVDGSYDLRSHVFVVNDEVTNPTTTINMSLERSADSPEHSEAALQPHLEEQLRALAGVALTDEILEQYRAGLATPPGGTVHGVRRSLLQVENRQTEPIRVDIPPEISFFSKD